MDHMDENCNEIKIGSRLLIDGETVEVIDLIDWDVDQCAALEARWSDGETDRIYVEVYGIDDWRFSGTLVN